MAVTTLWPLQKRAKPQFLHSQGQAAPDPSFSSLLPRLLTQSLADSLCLVLSNSNTVEEGLISQKGHARGKISPREQEVCGSSVLGTQSPWTAIWFHLDVSRNNNNNKS